MASIETPVSRRLASVKNIIIVVSGKGQYGRTLLLHLFRIITNGNRNHTGGVGKSSSTVQLALSLFNTSPTTRVGLLDLDLTGPSLPRMLGLDGQSVHQSSNGWVPVYADRERRLGCMSIGFLLKDRGDSVVWRGPKKDGMIRQFLAEVRWGDLDYLVIDTPPGTSDEHISLLTHLHPLFLPNPNRPPPSFCPTPTCVLITTPQTTALNDTLKSLSFTRKPALPVLGLVENMAGYVCPCCGEISDIFSKGGGQEMAQREEIGWLGRVPIDTKLVKLLDDVVKGSVENVTPAQDGESVYVPTGPEDAEGDVPRPPPPVQDASDDLRKLDVSEKQWRFGCHGRTGRVFENAVPAARPVHGNDIVEGMAGYHGWGLAGDTEERGGGREFHPVNTRLW
ncbi:cytosolic Fe-S cluster assembly factor cfd1 [Naganishia adeliensis]|uniref:Cytosolic Fe-S cluster assembly factor cfd1 n=1 Tax=Naganishia adeliensis TaxID=92952 RepID=A0ACC2WRU4_9TREE|nr:cytosolic Fe-S cluster assembly factor cfd1 [Naganishia adeliensis]